MSFQPYYPNPGNPGAPSGPVQQNGFGAQPPAPFPQQPKPLQSAAQMTQFPGQGHVYQPPASASNGFPLNGAANPVNGGVSNQHGAFPPPVQPPTSQFSQMGINQNQPQSAVNGVYQPVASRPIPSGPVPQAGPQFPGQQQPSANQGMPPQMTQFRPQQQAAPHPPSIPSSQAPQGAIPGQFAGMPNAPGQAPQGFPPVPSQHGMPPTPSVPGMPSGPPAVPGMPGIPSTHGNSQAAGSVTGMPPQGASGMPPQPGMLGMPSQGAPAMPGMPPQGAPGMPGMPFPGAPGMPGMPLPGQPGMPPSGAPGMPGMPAGPPGMPGYPQQPQRQRLDPNMMPSAVAVMEDDNVRSGLFPTGFPTAECPPLVSTDFYVQDQGNCNPRMMRSTLYVAPASQDLLKNSNIPFAVSCSPFARLHPKEYEPPVIDLGPGGPVRCQRCKAYMCPFMEFQDGGRRFRCPFCHASTPVEDVYFAHLDHTGRRTDIEHRPELFLGAYDFVATKQYCKNGLPPKEPAYIFMIDVSYNAVSSGMLNVLCHNLEKVLQSLPKEHNQDESSIHVGLATFDQAVHFYDLSSSKPSMMVVGDVNEMFVPIVDGLLLPYSKGAASIRAVLAELPKLFSQTKTTETMLGPVVNAGLDALKCADRAGKLFVFSTSLPTMEAPGKLKTKNDRALLGTEKEKTALTPQVDYYTKLGEQCVKAGVTVDLFLFPNSFIDVATIGQLSAVTGGSVYKYQYFSPEKDTVRFMTDLQADVAHKIGFDCMVRVRSSAGIRPVTFMGSFYMENSTDLEIASIDDDKAFFAELKHDDKLTDPTAVIQCAILYTSITGQRRLRILNLCLPVSQDYNQLYRVADPDTLHTYFLKTAVQINREKGYQEIRNVLSQRCAQILATYREKCSENAPLGQLILPETLKLLPLFGNSILKNDAVGGGAEMTVDDKAWMIELIRGMTVGHAMRMLYPRVYPIADLEVQDAAELTQLPSPVRASMEYMQGDKAYLIDAGFILFLWVGLGVSDGWIRDVFGANTVQQIDTENHVIPEKDNSKSRALRRAISLLDKGIRTRKTYVIRQQDGLEPWMKKYLVEDKSSPNSMSYVEFLCHVHREIRNILS